VVAVPLAVLVGLTLPQAPVPVALQVTVQVTPEFDESFVTVAVTVNVAFAVTEVALAATETEITAGGVVVVEELLPPPQATSAAIMIKLATSENDWRSLIGFPLLFFSDGTICRLWATALPFVLRIFGRVSSGYCPLMNSLIPNCKTHTSYSPSVLRAIA
jgi:hypothetical protein